MQFSILTAASAEYWPILQLTAPNKLAYCLKCGYDLIARRYIDLVTNWGERERQMVDALTSIRDGDYLFFMGADTLIMNSEWRLETIAGMWPEADLIIGMDINGINNDVFLLKRSTGSFNFLAKVISRCTIDDNDQAAMANVINGGIDDFKVQLVRQRLFNSYLVDLYDRPDDPGKYEAGDFVLHMPGFELGLREKIIQQYLPLAK